MKTILSLALTITIVPSLLAQARADTGYAMKDPPNLLGKEAFSVPRGPDGRCEWMYTRTTRQPKPITESAYPGEKHESTCKGVMFFVSIPKEYQIGGDSLKPGPNRTTSVGFMPHIWEGPDTLSGRGRELRDIVNLVVPRLPAKARVNQVMIDNERNARVHAFITPSSGIEYRLEKTGDRWALLPGQTPFDRGK